MLMLYGTAIRFYDQKLTLDAVLGSLQPMDLYKLLSTGRLIMGFLESKTAEGYSEKWIFSQIKPYSFRWHSEETHANGKTWLLTEEMHMRKVGVVH